MVSGSRCKFLEPFSGDHLSRLGYLYFVAQLNHRYLQPSSKMVPLFDVAKAATSLTSSLACNGKVLLNSKSCPSPWLLRFGRASENCLSIQFGHTDILIDSE